MLVHIVAWKYKPETTEDVRESHRAKLKALTGLIPGIQGFDVGEDILKLDRSYDTGLVARYADRKSLDEYSVHPAHQEVAGMGKKIAEHVVSVDFFTD